VYWQVVMLGIAVAVAVVMLGLAVFMPPAPPTPPQLYVKVVPSGESYLLYVNDSGKAIAEVWYSKNGGPLLMANGPIRAECGDRVEVIAVYEDGSRQSVATVVKCAKPLQTVLSESLPTSLTYSYVSNAVSDTLDAIINKRPYEVRLSSLSCGIDGNPYVNFRIAIWPKPVGSITQIKTYRIYSSDGFSTSVSATYDGITGSARNNLACGEPWGCPWIVQKSTWVVKFNYTTLSTSGVGSDYQGSTSSNATLEITYDMGTKVWRIHWNGEELGSCNYDPARGAVVVDRGEIAITKPYEYLGLYPMCYLDVIKMCGLNALVNPSGCGVTCERGYNLFITSINGRTGQWSGYGGVDIWRDPVTGEIIYGLHVTYTDKLELPKTNTTISISLQGGRFNVTNYSGRTISDEGYYMNYTGPYGERVIQKYVPPKVVGTKRLISVVFVEALAMQTNIAGPVSESGVGFEIPDLYFMTTFGIKPSNGTKAGYVISTLTITTANKSTTLPLNAYSMR